MVSAVQVVIRSITLSQLPAALPPDFVLVLSLKGQFQYVAPAVRRVLEYDPEDLMGKHIADICHPSDIVPVMRELKDSSHASSDGSSSRLVDLLFRVRRKRSGYVWLECTGRLHVEPGKGRKAVILSGRERAMTHVSWSAIDSQGGLADLEFWARLSFDGMILWASEQVAEVLGVRLEDAVGRSYFSFLHGAREVAPPSALPMKDAHPAATAIEHALTQASEGLPRKGAITVQHQLAGEDGRIVNVTAVFYAVVSEADVFDIPDKESPASVDSDASLSSGHVGVAGCPASQVLVQVKVTGSKNHKLLPYGPADNVFEELDTTRGTSWQYEIHQLKTANRRLNEEITILQSGLKNRASFSGRGDGDKLAKNKKRKAMDLPANDMPPPPLPLPAPRTDHPVPLHQQSLGFGLAPSQQTLSRW
jgi:PAS domain S-box-containing protein